MNKKSIAILGVLIFIGIVFAPNECINASLRGLKICYKSILPSLFPFFIAAKLMIKTGVAKKLGKWCEFLMRPLFNVSGSGAFVFVIGILSGYPLGAKCAGELYESNLISKNEANRLVCFCNNSGPSFVIGSVGASMLCDKNIGFMLYIIHILSAITVGIIMAGFGNCETIKISKTTTSSKSNENIFASSIKESVELILYVCGYIVFFCVLAKLLEFYKVFGMLSSIALMLKIDYNVSNAFFTGILEMTNGISLFSSINNINITLPIISFLLGFGGISIILQVCGILSEYKLNKALFIYSKSFQGVISFLYCTLFVKILRPNFNINHKNYSGINFFSNSIILICIGVFVILIISFIGLLLKKTVKRGIKAPFKRC